MPETLHVKFSDACSDVLVWLADQPRDNWWTPGGVADAVAPKDAGDPLRATVGAMGTLHGCGLIEGKSFEGIAMWRATDAGIAAVAEARTRASSQPIPTNGAKS
jgi:hypothetical protein